MHHLVWTLELVFILISTINIPILQLSILTLTMSPLYLLSLLTCCPVLLVSGQCDIDPDSSATWPQWPAIITDQAGDFILPQGEDNNRRITLQEDTVSMAQPGASLILDQ